MPGLICKILDSTEFWSAIVGAIVGGLIALGAQMLALRADRKRREEDHKREQQALAASLLFKMMRIHSIDLAFALGLIHENVARRKTLLKQMERLKLQKK
jgi:predicted acylesterase/phospholipase RssA